MRMSVCITGVMLYFCFMRFTIYFLILKTFICPYLGISQFGHPAVFWKLFVLDTALVLYKNLRLTFGTYIFFFKIITRNKALPCTLNIQIQKFLKVINTMLIVSKNLFTHFKIELSKKHDLLKNEVL